MEASPTLKLPMTWGFDLVHFRAENTWQTGLRWSDSVPWRCICSCFVCAWIRV